MSADMKIGVTCRMDLLEDRGEVRDAVDQALTITLREFFPDCTIVYLPNLTPDVSALARSLSLNTFVLSGGNDHHKLPEPENVALARDDLEAAILSYSSENDIPVWGICRGLQAMLLSTGERLETLDGHVGTYHRVYPRGTPGVAGASFSVNSYHNYGLSEAEMSPSWIPLATAQDGSVEAARHKRNFWIGTMWHPERRNKETSGQKQWIQTHVVPTLMHR